MHQPASTCRLYRLCAAWWWSAAALVSPSASAGSWETTTPAGMQLHIIEDATRTRDGYVLERRHADGRADARFGSAGSAGSILFSLGPDNGGPADVQVDPAGRAWVVGSTAGPEGVRAVVLRFLTDGQPDLSFAQRGRASLAPRGLPARATEVLPLGDGSAWVAGHVIGPSGDERSGAWRVHADGSLDTRFGLGGLWQDTEAGESETVGLVPNAGGVALGVRRGDGARMWLETWAWDEANTTPRRLARIEADTMSAERARFSAINGVARWLGADGQPIGPAPATLPAAAASVAETAAAAPRPADLVSPFPASPAASAPPAAPASVWPNWVLWAGAAAVAAAVAAALIAVSWHRRRAVNVDRDGRTPSRWPPRRR